MRTLIVGIGALGGVIAARLHAAGAPVSLATRSPDAAATLRAAGLLVSGIAGPATIDARDVEVDVLEAFGRKTFDLVVLATKAADAIVVAPRAAALLAAGGTLLPIQNGGVSQILTEALGPARVLGGLSNLGATMSAPGVYEQRNAGHILVGELSGGDSERTQRVREHLGRGVAVRTTGNLRGAIWSKLLLNCSVTTLGAIAGQTMRVYVGTPSGRALFDRAYDEALSVALASGAQPERMIVDPMPPGWSGRSVPGPAHGGWIDEVLRGYGDLKPSMLQDFERGRPTEVDFINGYVVEVGRSLGMATPVNEAIVAIVHAITRGEISPGSGLLDRVLEGLKHAPA